MLLHQHPAFTYITWQGLVIVEYDPFDSSKVMQQYIISDDKTCDKYVYWDKQDPYILKTSNEWVTSNATTKLLFINDEGEGTEVPVEDIDYFYTNKGGGSSGGIVSGKMLGMFNEIDGKFISITEDIDGIKQTIGEITEEGGFNATITEKLNKLEQTAEGNTQIISEIKTKYEQNEEEEKLRNDVNVAFIDMMTILSEYERIISTASKDLVIEDTEKIDIDNQKNKLIAQLSIINACHEIITEKVKDVETLNEVERANVLLNDTVSGLNNHVTTIISGGKIDISDITTMLNYIADTSLKIKNYQGVLSDALLLGVGGSVISNIHTMTETSREYNRGITALEEVINGETGLVETIESHGTWITQTSEDLSLKYVKYDKTTAELTVSDETIKLDAGKVLMTGTLTWDSLDQDAKENLKGEDGTAEYITISGDQIIKYNENGDPNIESITLSAITSNLGNLLFTWYYRDTNDTWVKITTTDIGKYTINHDDSIWKNRDAITIRVSVTKDVITYYDDITLVKVRDGIDGTKNYVMVTGNQIFKYEDSFETTPTPMSLALTGTCYGFTTDIYSWYYENTSGEWIKINNEVSNVLILPHTSPYFEGRETLTIKFEAGLYNDTITVAKLLDGSDGYYVTLTNQAHVVPCDENGNYSSSDLENAKTEIHVYRGATEVGFSFSKVDKGCTSIYNSSTKTLSLTKLTDDSATVTITITVNNKSFVKVMNIAKAKKGSMGEGLTVKGYFNSVDELPTTGNVVGDAYIIGTKLYVWSDKTNAWSDGIEFAGREGIPGKDGVDGKTTYIHIKYSDDGKTFTSNDGETPGKWMGQYTDFIEQDSTNFSTYTWFKVQGEDGYNGIVANLTNDSHVIPCNADGSYSTDAFAGCITQIILSYNGTQINSGVTYSYVKSNSILGTFTSSNGKFTATGWSDNSVTSGYVDMIANYEGVNYTKRFTITKAKGGSDSITINLSNDSHVFVANQSGDLIGETSVTINVTAYKGENKVTATIGTLPTVTGLTLSKSGETITIRASKTMATVGSIAIPITVGNISAQRDFNYSKVTCGNDGYTVMLTNESEIFNCSSDGTIKEAITKTTKVLAYKGTAQATPTIGTLPTVTGLTLSKSGDTITIKANTGANLAENGYFDIPITVDGVSFTKRFSWTKVRNGSAGDLPSWITDWSSNVTTINNTSVISPKIFAGTVTNGVPTGVAIGKNVFGTSGTYSNVNGIVGYKNGTKNYEFNVNGDVLIGNIDDQYISWSSSGLKINANTITLKSQGIVTSSQLETTQEGILATVSETYTTKTQLNTTNGNVTTAQTTADSALSKANTNASNITTITNKYSTLEQNVDKFKTTVSETYATKTQLNTTNSNVTNAQNTANTAKTTADSALTKANTNATNISTITTKQSTLEQNVDSFKTTVSSTYATKTQLNTTNSNVTTAQNTANTANTNASNALNKANTNASNISSISSKQSTLEQTVNNFKTTVSSTYSTKTEVQSLSSTVDQTANKISWIVKSGSSASNMTLTDKMYSLISSNITLSADRINLNGYVNANGTFQVDTRGNVMLGDPMDSAIYLYADDGAIMCYDALVERSTIQNGKFYFKNNNGTKIGNVGANYWVNDTSKWMTAVNAEYGQTIGLGAKYSSNDNYQCSTIISSIDQYLGSYQYYQGTNINGGHFTNGLDIHSTRTSYEANCAFIEGTQVSGSGLRVYGNNYGLALGVRNNASLQLCLRYTLDSSQTNGVYGNAYAPINMNGYKIYNSSISSTSDRTLKENIKYLDYNNINSRAKTIENDDITLDDMYNFINNDYMLANYNYIGEEEKTISAIAQDLLVNIDGTDNKVGQLITHRCKKTEDDGKGTIIGTDSENGKTIEQAEMVESETIAINQTELLNITIGAFQKACEKIESLEKQIQQLQDIINGEK